MPDLFERALKETLGHEGGWYDGSEARDPNPTMYGVTQTTYDKYRRDHGRPNESVRNITMGEVQDIYRSYWTGASCDKLSHLPLTAIQVFDHSINAGPVAAAKLLQRALGFEGEDVDGKVGKNTLESIRLAKDDKALVNRFMWARVRFYVDLAKSPRLRPNLLSWVHRVVKSREKLFDD